MIEDDQRPEHWRRSRRLAVVVLASVLGVVLAVPLFIGLLDEVFVLRLPLGFYLAAQGAIIVCIIASFWFASRQERMDRGFGAAEDV